MKQNRHQVPFVTMNRLSFVGRFIWSRNPMYSSETLNYLNDTSAEAGRIKYLNAIKWYLNLYIKYSEVI